MAEVNMNVNMNVDPTINPNMNVNTNYNPNMNVGGGVNANVNYPQLDNVNNPYPSPGVQGQVNNYNYQNQSQPQVNTAHIQYQQNYQPQQPTIVIAQPSLSSVQLNTAKDTICGNQIPYLDPTTGLVILILNIIFPGLGTMIVGCVGRNANCCAWFFIGFAQYLLVFCIVGWIWSILTGIQVYSKASQPRIATLI